tara:strand:+ start:2573 stop:3271 length:699 start_codon:yes stop_codon:yes gene_type:complete
MMPGEEEALFDDPQLMQQLLGIPQQPMQEQFDDQSSPGDRDGQRLEKWASGLILCGILLIISWIAVPFGAFGAWFYGPIEGFFAQPVFSRFEVMTYLAFFLTLGAIVAYAVDNARPKLHWVENDPGVPRVTSLKSIEDNGGSYVMTRRDGKTMRVRKDIASRYRNLVHITAHVLEIDGQGVDIEFRTTSGSMSRGQIAAEEDLANRQGFREQQLEEISQRYVAGQMDQIEGV